MTELVTGIDLVEWQIRIAAGEPLPLTQDQIPLNGHALEVRLYAEDPARDFMPATGRLTRLHLPNALTRIDTGVTQGDTVTPHYDPMIAKVIAHGADREAAFAAMELALAASDAQGVTTNLAFLERLIRHQGVRAGTLDTGLIGRDLAALTAPPETTASDLALAGAALTRLLTPTPLAGWRPWGTGETHLELTRMTGPESAEITELTLRLDDGTIITESAIGEARLSATPVCGTLWQVKEGDRTRQLYLHQTDGTVTIARDGHRLSFSLTDPMAAAEATAHGGDCIAAPLPGIVKSLNVAPGDLVATGDILAVMEAMKMEHSLTAPRDGTIAEVAVRAGEQVEEGALLIALEPANE